MPVGLYVRRVVPLKQSAAGGELHVTVAQGSPAHVVPLQPKEQVVSFEVYWHAPLEQLPPDQVRRVELLTQLEGGGWLHVIVAEL